MVPTITVFVKHSTDCKDRFEGGAWRRCRCRKYLRWFHDGKQHRQAVKTRSWDAAEDARRELERKFEVGAAPKAVASMARKTIEGAIELFLSAKRTDGLNPNCVDKLERELGRFKDFMATRSKLFPTEIDLETLIEYRATWENLYPSSATRSQVQARLRRFLRFCNDAGWLDRVPRLSAIAVDRPPTLPLSDKQYEALLAAIPKEFPTADKAAKVRALVQLMRHSGLAIRDAVTIRGGEIQHDAKRKITRVTTSRQKTGTHVSVPLPPTVATEILAVTKDNEHPFWSGQGLEQSAVTNWQHDLRAVFRSAFGIKTKFTPHCLRDTAACGWLTAGIPLEEVAKLLGHSSSKTTEKHYAPWVKERQNRLDALVIATWQEEAAR